MAKVAYIKHQGVQVRNVGPEQTWNGNSKFVPDLFHFGSQYVPPMFLFPLCSEYKTGQTRNTTYIPRLFTVTISQEWGETAFQLHSTFVLSHL